MREIQDRLLRRGCELIFRAHAKIRWGQASLGSFRTQRPAFHRYVVVVQTTYLGRYGVRSTERSGSRMISLSVTSLSRTPKRRRKQGGVFLGALQPSRSDLIYFFSQILPGQRVTPLTLADMLFQRRRMALDTFSWPPS